MLFNWPEFGDKLIIGKFCALASGTQFIMGPPTTGPAASAPIPSPCSAAPGRNGVPPHLDQLPRKGDIVVGNDVWIGRNSVILPGVHIGDGAVIAAQSVVSRDVPPYTVYGGNPARFLKERFSPELNRWAADYLSRLTGGRYRELSLDRELDASATEGSGVLPRRALFLSKGTVDKIYLAVRLAVYDLCLKERRAPLVLDDALAAFDDGRMALALDLLAQLAEDRQILLFTCRPLTQEEE
mgnify:CR=1 FL=1